MSNRRRQLQRIGILVAALAAVAVFAAAKRAKGRGKTSPPLMIGNISIQTNMTASAVQLSMSNTTPNILLVSVRSTITRSPGGWNTNYSRVPRFIGGAGPGSTASELAIGPGAAITTLLSPVSDAVPFQIEFVCFAKRAGVKGIVDSATDQLHSWNEGSTHTSFKEDAFYVTTPTIDPKVVAKPIQ